MNDKTNKLTAEYFQILNAWFVSNFSNYFICGSLLIKVFRNINMFRMLYAYYFNIIFELGKLFKYFLFFFIYLHSVLISKGTIVLYIFIFFKKKKTKAINCMESMKCPTDK